MWETLFPIATKIGQYLELGSGQDSSIFSALPQGQKTPILTQKYLRKELIGGVKIYESKMEIWHNVIQHKKYVSYLPDYVRDWRKFPNIGLTLCTTENILFSGSHEVEVDKWTFQAAISEEALASKLPFWELCRSMICYGRKSMFQMKK